jgi:UDP-3-O-[3-hydroxymyristoyl] glucosamine N-acyltransferase
MRRSFSLKDLADKLGGTFKGDGSLPLNGIAPLLAAKEGDLTFVTHPRYAKDAKSTSASAILCEQIIPGVDKPFLIVRNPYLVLAQVISLFHPTKTYEPGIRSGVIADSSAKIHETSVIFAGVTLCPNTKVGARTILFPGVFLGEDGVIGDDCLIYPNVTIREKCVVGDRVILQPGVVVGSDGFGFARDNDRYIKIPQVGNVVLEDDVELGANVCVDRAVLGTTRIGQGTKLDNLIQVGHNVMIGRHGVIAAQTGIAGSTIVGDFTVMGGQVGLAGHLKIGDHVTLATRTGVMEDIPDKGVYWGSPSAAMTIEMKNVAAYRQLPELIKRIRQLEKTLERLQGLKTDES